MAGWKVSSERGECATSQAGVQQRNNPLGALNRSMPLAKVVKATLQFAQKLLLGGRGYWRCNHNSFHPPRVGGCRGRQAAFLLSGQNVVGDEKPGRS
jgi:hypothetical protein